MKFIFDENKISEANIQAELYHELRLLNIPAYLQYRIDDCVFDMIILDKKKENIIAIVEVKSWSKNGKPKINGKQYEKYIAYGLPLIYCGGFEYIPTTISAIINIYNGSNGD